jgi:hypothetical protein
MPLAQFAQSSDPAYPLLDSRLTSSTTGRTITGVHPLCTVENIFNSAPEFPLFAFPTWDPSQSVKKGTMWVDETVYYTALTSLSPAQNTVAPHASANWEASDPFSQWLYDIKYQCAIDVVTSVFRNRKIANYSKTLMENTRLYEGGGILTDRVINSGDFVGFAIELKPNQNIINYITQIGIQLDTAINNLPIYIFHSSLSDPVYRLTINAKGGLNFNWNDILDSNSKPVAIKHYDNNVDTGHDLGGIYFIGYYQKDLGSAQAIEKRFNLSVAPCLTCNQFNLQAYRVWNKFIKATAIKVDSEDLTSGAPKMWDITRTQFVYDTNWGFNLAFSVQCDVSQFICANAGVFADAYAKQVGLKCLEQIANSTRMNGVAMTTKQLAATELDPKTSSGSLRAYLNDAIAAVDWDISGFDINCIPCSTKGKLTYESI